jgi:periplasmic mercuric ion binding protein
MNNFVAIQFYFETNFKNENTMKVIKLLFVFVVSSQLWVSCKKNETSVAEKDTIIENTVVKPKRVIAKENLQTAKFAIEGMTCAMGCAKTIESKLTNSDGIETAVVDFDKKLATVSFDKTALSPLSIATIVGSTGDGKTYKAVVMK